jgi:triacylglycerol lipase
MSGISPTLSAALADSVYALARKNSIADAIKDLDLLFKNILAFSDSALIKGKTGGPWFIKCRTGFGFTLIGKGRYQGHAFILFRGTQYLADWLTNLNVICSRSSLNEPVHDGFNTAFKSMQPKIEEFVASFKSGGIHTVHCIGHSLGGALATLCGEWLTANCKIKPFIYTFGSPRVGLQGFATACTREIGGERMYRAYHKTDVVPCIPVWPYVHTPNDDTEYYLPSPGVLPGAEYHGMNKYLDSVKDKSWQVLAGIKPELKTDASIAAWLKEQGPTGVTVAAIGWLDAAIRFVIRKCIAGAEWLMAKAMGTSATILDRLAYLLSNGVTLEENISVWVVHLIRKILSFLGQSRNISKVELNRAFIRSVLTQLQQKLNAIAQNALSNALVSGRAI